MNFHPQISNQDGGNSIKERRHRGRCIKMIIRKHIFAQCQICIRSQVCKCQTKATILSTIAMMELESLLRKRSLSRGLHTGDFCHYQHYQHCLASPGITWLVIIMCSSQTDVVSLMRNLRGRRKCTLTTWNKTLTLVFRWLSISEKIWWVLCEFWKHIFSGPLKRGPTLNLSSITRISIVKSGCLGVNDEDQHWEKILCRSSNAFTKTLTLEKRTMSSWTSTSMQSSGRSALHIFKVHVQVNFTLLHHFFCKLNWKK